MVKKKMYQKIQKLKKNGCNKTQIALQLQIDPTTVRKYYYMSPKIYNKYRNDLIVRKKDFDDFKQEILEIYKLNNYQKLNMAAIYDFLEEKYIKLPGNEKTLRNYIHYLITSGQLKLKAKTRCYIKVPDIPYGKQMQIDFGVYKTRSGLKLYIFAAVLSASRYKYIGLQDTPFTTIDLINHLLDCFDYIGGIPEELVIDQDSIIVVSENYGDIIYTKKFASFIEEMKLKMYVCRKSDPESKGKIENVIRYVKYNFFQIRDFNLIEDAIDSLYKWLKRRGNGKISQATKKVPILAIEEERLFLRSIMNSIFRKDSLLGRELRIVSDKSFIMVDTNEYSVPAEYKNRKVEIFKTEKDLYVFDEKNNSEIACHKLSLLTGQRIIKHRHFRNNSCSIKDLHKKTFDLYDFDSWKVFVEKNIKTYSRYSRDQCIYAGKNLQNIEDVNILEMAVEYCLENKTYSMGQLKDTFQYHLQEYKEEQSIIQDLFTNLSIKTNYSSPDVKKRDLTEYENIINAQSGVEK